MTSGNTAAAPVYVLDSDTEEQDDIPIAVLYVRPAAAGKRGAPAPLEHPEHKANKTNTPSEAESHSDSEQEPESDPECDWSNFDYDEADRIHAELYGMCCRCGTKYFDKDAEIPPMVAEYFEQGREVCALCCDAYNLQGLLTRYFCGWHGDLVWGCEGGEKPPGKNGPAPGWNPKFEPCETQHPECKVLRVATTSTETEAEP